MNFNNSNINNKSSITEIHFKCNFFNYSWQKMKQIYTKYINIFLENILLIKYYK